VALVAGVFDRDSAKAAIPLVIAAAVILVLGPHGLRDLIGRLRKLSLPGLGTYEFAGTRDFDPSKAKGLVDLRLLIQAQLAYLAKHSLVDERGRTYVTIGSLRHDRLIDDREAALLDRVLTMSESEFSELPDARELLDSARHLSSHLLYAVFYRYVRRGLELRGWKVEQVPVKRERYDDLRASADGRPSMLLQPVGLPWVVDATCRRLAEPSDERARRVVVVPGEQPPESCHADVAVEGAVALLPPLA
jgi:hypothetical protein